MKKIFYLLLALAMTMALVACGGGTSGLGEVPTEYKTQYHHNYKWGNFNLVVNIEDKYTITGEVFSSYEDNLTMTDGDGTVIRTMTDKYNLVSQNDHTISGGEVKYFVKGLVNLATNSYDVYVGDELVANVSFNMTDTEGILYDADGVKIAQYTSKLFGYDYIVSIFEGCEIEDEDILMIFASYVSDKIADSRN